MSKYKLQIEDDVNGNLSAISKYILHPTVQCFQIDKHQFELKMPNGKIAHFISEVGEISVVKAVYYPEFGRKVDTQALIVKLIQGKAISFLSWN